MYMRRIKHKNLFQQYSLHFRYNQRNKSRSLGDYRINYLLSSSHTGCFSASTGFFRNYLLGSVSTGCLRCCRCYSSEDKESSPSDFDKVKTAKVGVVVHSNNIEEHASRGEHDKEEWINNEKFCTKRKESPFLTKKDRFKNEYSRQVLPWEKILVSWKNFPYYIDEYAKNILVECAASHLRHRKHAESYGSRLSSSSGRIFLQSLPGTELYRERFVKALAHDLQVPLLVLDSSVLAPYDFGQGSALESVAENENEDLGEECTSTSDENDTGNEETSESDDDSDIDEQVRASAEALRKLVPCSLEDFAKVFAERVSEEFQDDSTSTLSDAVKSGEDPKRPLKKGDRVKYIGDSMQVEGDHRSFSKGQRGEVFEINGDQVAVIIDNTEDNVKEGIKDENAKHDAKPFVYWFDLKDIMHDDVTQTEDWYIALEALSEVLPSLQPLIVYFPDSAEWLSRAVPRTYRREFIRKVEEMFDQLHGPVVLICGQNVVETETKEKDKFTTVLPHIRRLARLAGPLKQLTEGLGAATKSLKNNDLAKLFTNHLLICPPKEEELLRAFNKKIEDDRNIILSRNNLVQLHEVLEEHGLSCTGPLNVKTDGLNFTKQKAEKVIGWAKNYYLSSCTTPFVKGGRLIIPVASLDIAISRLREKEKICMKSSLNLKSLAKDEYERNFVSAVVPPKEVGVKFDDIGALEDVKTTLNELVTLPMRRPELFAHGNLLRPCKGILLFGPPGTGKTLLAKALATEAGANFISITGSILSSKWFGDAEKLTKALFSFAGRLAPVIIFIDEVDSLLGARGGSMEHEATRRMRNEFMAAWDGLRSKDSQRILILGATNRPFDLDDAVIRRLPRRIYVDLPDAGNRAKILKILLSRENLEEGFRHDELANATEGYSGSDLKNLCIAAAYRPVQELIEAEKNGRGTRKPTLRPLNLEDFIQAKAKVGASVAYDAASMNELRKWSEMYGEGGNRRKAPFGFGN